jgi:hypothetical protein
MANPYKVHNMVMIQKPTVLEETCELTPGVDYSQFDMSSQFMNEEEFNESNVLRESSQYVSYEEGVKSFEAQKASFYNQQYSEPNFSPIRN